MPRRPLPPTTDDATTWDPGGDLEGVERARRRERYEDRELLGRGGMGDVVQVYDHRLRREVAMKVLRADKDTVVARARFQQEAQITGQLEHPNIVPVHDVGHREDGRPWFTMKRVDGEALDAVLDGWGQQVASGELDYAVAVLRAVEILRRVCDATAFAHSRGVVHRDLKPANVMVGAFGEVQVMDWGLARIGPQPDIAGVSSDHGSALLTRDGSLAGTPAYMAPEQASGRNSTVGPPADIWALCAMLYEALTFTRPFQGDLTTILSSVRTATIEPPSARRPDLAVPRELEAVVLRGMARNPADRYGSVADLGADLQAWVEGRPLASLDYSPRQLATMWVKRNRALITGAAIATGFAAIVGIGGVVRYVQDLSAAEAEARLALAEGRVATAEALAATGRYAEARAQYRAALPELERLGADRTAARMGLWATYHRSSPPTWRLELPDNALAVAGSTSRRFFVWANDRLEERAWPSGRIVRDWDRPLPGRAKGLRLEAGRPVLYSRGADDQLYRSVGVEGAAEPLFAVPQGRLRFPDDDSATLVWVAGGDEPVSTAWHPAPDGWTPVPLGNGYPDAVAGGRAVLTKYASNVRLVDLETGLEVLTLVENHAYAALDGDTAYLFDEQRDELRAMDLVTGEDRWRLDAKNLMQVVLSGDGAVVWASGLEPAVLAVDAATGRLLGRLEGHANRVTDLVPLPGGLLTRAGKVWMGWSIPGEDPLGQVTQAPAEAMAVSPDGRLLALGGERVRVWDIDTGWLLAELPPAPRVVRDLDFVGTQSLWVTRGKGGATRWRLTDRLVTARIDEPVHELGVAADASLWVAGNDGALTRADADGTPRWTRQVLESRPWDVVPVDDGALISDFKGNALVVVDEDGTELRRLEVGRRAYRIDPHGQFAATGTWGGKALIWDWRTGTLHRTLTGHEGPVLDVAFSPDGRYLATASFDWKLRVFEVETGDLVAVDSAHAGTVGIVDWLSDGRIVSGAADDRVLVRDLDLPGRLQAGMALASRHAGDDAALTRKQAEQLARYAADRRDWTMAAVAARRAADRLPALDRARWAALADRRDEAQTWLDEAREARAAPESYLALLQSALDRMVSAD